MYIDLRIVGTASKREYEAILKYLENASYAFGNPNLDLKNESEEENA